MQRSCICDCGGKHKMMQFKNDERLIQFLMRLNETYAQARSNILMINPLPSVNHAYSLLMQDENQREVHVSSQFLGDGTSFMAGQQNTQINKGNHINYQQKIGHNSVKGNNNPKGKKNGQMCSYCKMTNHTIENCYRLIGFLSDFKFTKPKKFQGTAKGNSATTMEQLEGIQSNSVEGPQFAQKLSPDQFSQLVQLLNQIQVGQSGSSEVSANSVTANSAVGPSPEEPSSLW